MFLIRLIHLKSIRNNSMTFFDEKNNSIHKVEEKDDLIEIKDKIQTIGQIKNISQEKDP